MAVHGKNICCGCLKEYFVKTIWMYETTHTMVVALLSHLDNGCKTYAAFVDA